MTEKFPLFIGIVASILTAISLLPQLIKLIKEKKAENISLNMLVLLMLGLCCWIYYGILHDDWVIIISNGVSLLVNILIVGYTLRYKSHAT